VSSRAHPPSGEGAVPFRMPRRAVCSRSAHRRG
jgi:hypothetical protein